MVLHQEDVDRCAEILADYVTQLDQRRGAA
jgi:hypothetical protein